MESLTDLFDDSNENKDYSDSDISNLIKATHIMEMLQNRDRLNDVIGDDVYDKDYSIEYIVPFYVDTPGFIRALETLPEEYYLTAVSMLLHENMGLITSDYGRNYSIDIEAAGVSLWDWVINNLYEKVSGNSKIQGYYDRYSLYAFDAFVSSDYVVDTLSDVASNGHMNIENLFEFMKDKEVNQSEVVFGSLVSKMYNTFGVLSHARSTLGYNNLLDYIIDFLKVTDQTYKMSFIILLYINDFEKTDRDMFSEPCDRENGDKSTVCIDTLLDMLEESRGHTAYRTYSYLFKQKLLDKLPERKCKNKITRKPISCIEKAFYGMLKQETLGLDLLPQLYQNYDITKSYFNDGSNLLKKVDEVKKNLPDADTDKLYYGVMAGKYFKKLKNVDPSLFESICKKTSSGTSIDVTNRRKLENLIVGKYSCNCSDVEDGTEDARRCYDNVCADLGRLNTMKGVPEALEIVHSMNMKSTLYPDNTPGRIIEHYIKPDTKYEKRFKKWVKDPFKISGVYKIEHKGKKLLLVITQDPRDLYRASSCQNWTSCVDIPKRGQYSGSVSKYMEYGSYIAYIVKNRWDTTWLARILVHIGHMERYIRGDIKYIPVPQEVYTADQGNYKELIDKTVWSIINQNYPEVNIAKKKSSQYKIFPGSSVWNDIDTLFYARYDESEYANYGFEKVGDA